MRSQKRAAEKLQPTPIALWVYGSAARGSDRPDSDIDVALVSYATMPSIDAEELRKRIERTASSLARRVSVIALSHHDASRMAQRRSKFWRELERDAVVLFGDSPASFSKRPKRSATKR